MSAKKGSAASSVVVGGTKKSRVGPRARLTVLAVAGLVLVTAIAAGGWLAYQKLAGSDSKPGKTSKIPEAAQKTTQINGQPITQTQRSQQAIYYGEYDQGQQLLKDQLSPVKTDDEKITIYLQLAGNALNAKKYSEADGYLQTALAIKKAPGVYALLAQSAAAQGDKKKAIEYANQQKQLLIDGKVPGYQMKVRDIDEFIKGQQ